MPNRLTTTILLAGAIGAVTACGSSKAVPPAGALLAPQPSTVVGRAGPAPVASTPATPPSIGGTPIINTRLSSGATPANSPVFTIRGTTWIPKKPLPPIPLASGGYEAEVLVKAELDAKTHTRYNCRTALALVGPTGSAVWRSTSVAAGGTSRSTFVAGAPTSVTVATKGSVGCNWVLVLLPA